MPIPEHVPSFIDTPASGVGPGHIHCMDDVNNAVKSVVWGITQHLQYTGVGRVLDTLFKTCPEVYTYLRSSGFNPESIPAIVEHKRLIQRVNTQLWAYATTRNVITLTDLEELLKADIPDQYMLLGPVVHIPSVLEIFQTSHFHPRIVDAFTLSQVPHLLLTNEHVLRELYDCVCHNRFRLPTVSNRRTEGAWWESVFTHHMLLVISIREVPRQLDRNTSYDYKLTDLAQFGIRVNGFSSLLQSVLANLRPENLTKASQIAQECLTGEVRKIYDKFASELLSQSALNTLRARKPVKALKHLAECASSLHGELSKWAEERGVSWPPGHLDSLLIFGQFIQRIANGGPFRTLVHLLLSISIRPSTSAEALIRNLVTAATQGADPQDTLNSDSFLRKVVQQFNEVMDKACTEESIAADCYHDEGFWRMLAELERSLLKSTPKGHPTNSTLLGLLANAVERDISGLNKVLHSTKISVPAEAISVDNDEDSEMGKPPASFSSTLDPYPVCQFVRKLTWLQARSVEDVCQLVSIHLHIPRSDELKQVVRSALNEFSAGELGVQDPVIYHVLELLAACPSLIDLEVWSQWSMPGMLLERWGELEQFLFDCGLQKARSEYNLLILRLLDGGGLLRLHTSLPTTDWEANFMRWSDHSNPQNVRNLCDLLIGSALGINTCNVTCSQGLLSVQLSKLAELETLNEIILPCVDEVGFRSIDSWSLDVPDLSTTLTNLSPSGILPLLRDAVLPKLTNAQDLVLVSAIGSLGLQLNWPAFVSYFEEHRLRTRGARALETNLPVAQNEEFLERLVVTPSSPPIPSVAVTETNATESNFEPDHLVHCDSNQTDREGFITALRRREFGCGAELSTEAVDLIRRVEGKLSRSLVQLSEDLYSQPGHFLLELIQNADDNEYHVSDKGPPTLEFCLILRTDSAATPAAALLVMNNEAVGFTEADMSSLCDVGVSTKLNQRNLKTGRKGIGFKSVFNVTDAPEVHSNGFHVRFHRHSLPKCAPTDESGSLLLVPEWCATTSNYNRDVPSSWPVPIPMPSWCKTMFVLPLSSKANTSVKQFTGVMQLAQETLQPSVMLFLRRLRCLTVSCVTEKKDDQKFPLTRRTVLNLMRTVFPLPSETSSAVTAELVSVVCMEQNLEPSDVPSATRRNDTHLWFCFKENLMVDDMHLSEGTPTQTELSLAISLTDPEPLPVYPVFAYLPIREAGFSFYINADFDLTSSREDVNSTSTWNQWLVSRIPTVFAHMIQYVLKLPEKAFDSVKVQLTACGCSLSATQYFLLGRFLASLPFISSTHTSSGSHSTAHHGNLFVGLPAHLRLRLSQLAWLPVVEHLSMPEIERLSGKTELSSSRFMSANRLLLDPSETKLGSKAGTEDQATQPSRSSYLIHLLMDRLGMREPHPELLCSDTNQVDLLPEDTSDSFGDHCVRVWNHDLAVYRSRRDSLLWLGAQTVSVDSLLELVSNLSKDDYIGLINKLGPLVTNVAFETGDSTLNDRHMEFSSLLTAAPPDGLGMRVAFPETVVSEWISPCLNSLSNLDDDALQHSDILNWLVVVGRVFVSSPRVSENPEHVSLPRRMPIVTSDHPNGWHILPALTTLSGGIRELPVFLPPASFTILQKSDVGTLEELESKLFHFLIDQLDEADRMRVVSNKYFEGFPSLVKHAYRWFQLFSGSGVCTLLSVHSTRYLVSTVQLTEEPESKSSSTLSACDLLPLPHGHRLWKIIVQTLTQAGLPESALNPSLSNDEWIIEDFVCPGLDLLLRLIARLPDRALAVEASYQLACLLHDNWLAFEGVDRAWFAKIVPEMSTSVPLTSVPGTVARPLGPACWLHHLRETAWLPIEHVNSVDSPPVLVSPCTAESHVYSPSVLIDLRTGRSDIVRLLLEACYVWSPGPHIVRDPPSLAFTNALGLSSELHRSTFDHLMLFLSTHMAKNNPLVEHLTPDLMVELYRIAVHCCTSTKSGDLSDDVEWLRSVFAHSDRSLIVVRCPNNTLLDKFTIDRRGKRPRQGDDGDHRRDLDGDLSNFACPICLASSQSLQCDQRRRQPSADLDSSKRCGSYHLVPPNLVCWTQARLPHPDSFTAWSPKRLRSDDEEEDDGTNAGSDQCVLSTSSINQLTSCDVPPVLPGFTDRRVFQLCTCYSFGCRSFFVDILGVASTSSIEQVLSLRPELCEAPASLSENQWCNFGRRLGQWYALLDHCLLEDGFVRIPFSLSTHKSQVNSSDVNKSNDQKMTRLLDQLWNFPLLFGFDGKWYKPCEVTTVSTYNGVHKNADSTATSTSSVCLFAWSKPLYARFIRMVGVVNSSVVVLAHSLRLLDSRHKPEPGQMQDSSVPASARLPSLAELGGKHLSSLPNEGTSHGLLLDTLGLPVNQLNVELQFHVPLLKLENQLLSRRVPVFVEDDVLYVDSTLGADLFARLSSLPKSHTAPLIYLCVGLLDDVTDDAGTTDSSLLASLADYVCPDGGSDRLTFIRFIQGFVNMAGSLVPDLRATLGSNVSFLPSAIHQLENYLISHGVRKLVAKRAVQQVCQPPEPTEPTAITCAPHPDIQHTLPPVTSSFASEREVTRAESSDNVPACPPISSSTRRDTVFGNFSVHIPFTRLGSDRTGSSSLPTSCSKLWAASVELTPNLADRLRRMLTQSVCGATESVQSLMVGRMGELYVYQRLVDMISRTQEKRHHFDQLSDLEFPTGHPCLGAGRVVQCRWCNANEESRRPFDLELEVQVECEVSSWDRMLSSVKDELAQNIVKIVRSPSKPHVNPSKPGLLLVGPIFLEVKSTAGRSTLAGGDCSTDMFEMSVPELVCASQQGWRYHLIRVLWDRDADNASTPSLTKAPAVVHVPDFVTALRTQPSFVKLCVAMLRNL
ncbi:uncharacterized protein DEA37_0006431 [Paragonimus westermani]|uniref:Sacsin/Nov domain-containing protein n=1 Tax=Paragonimus westermani TaxID=34504 RepID=A0A5J4NPF5_9TREM|nr:uncharacterized protein DEA37_0006431 [Paragonimus westermani]